MADRRTSWALALGPLSLTSTRVTRIAVVERRRRLRAGRLGSGRCSRRATRRVRSASSSAATPAERLRLERRATGDLPSRPSPRSRSRRAVSGRHALELAVEYVSEREQFGRRIGVYQAVSHPLAESVHPAGARALARRLGGVVCRHRRRRTRSPRPRAKSHAAEAAVRPASAPSRRTAGSASRGSTRCTGSTSGHSASRSWEASGAELRAEVAARLLDGGGVRCRA